MISRSGMVGHFGLLWFRHAYRVLRSIRVLRPNLEAHNRSAPNRPGCNDRMKDMSGASVCAASRSFGASADSALSGISARSTVGRAPTNFAGVSGKNLNSFVVCRIGLDWRARVSTNSELGRWEPRVLSVGRWAPHSGQNLDSSRSATPHWSQNMFMTLILAGLTGTAEGTDEERDEHRSMGRRQY